MPIHVHTTSDFYLASFLCHRGAKLLSLKRFGTKKVDFRFAANSELHNLLRLYWSGGLTPVVPWELFMCFRQLKNLSIGRYEETTFPQTSS